MKPATTIGARIRKMRCYLGLTQDEVAARIGKSLRSYSRIENDHVQPRADDIETLCKAFHCHSGYLMGFQVPG